MQKKLDEKTSLVPIGSNALVRLGNSIAITEKLLSEKRISIFESFEGKLYKSIKINQDSYYTVLSVTHNNIYLINKCGKILEIDIRNGEYSETCELFKSLNKGKIAPDDIFDKPNEICSYYLEGNNVYISSRCNNIWIYCINDKTIITKELSHNIDNSEFYEYFNFLPLEKMIYSYCNEWRYSEYSDEYTEDRRHIKLFDKQTFHLLHYLKAIDDFYYCELKYNSGYVYAINENGVDEYKGLILKQSTIYYNYSFIEAFKDSWVDDFKFLHNNLIVCYSNYFSGENDCVIRIINSINGEVVNEVIFENIIRSMLLIEKENILVLLFNDGKVIVSAIIDLQLKEINRFQYEGIVEFDCEVYPPHGHPPHILEVSKNQIVIGNRNQINIYR